jgi:ABC-type Fe3+/spermidine/putrescine transport system ATPase subunit
MGEPLAIYRVPNSRFVAEFMGQVNLLPIPPGSAIQGSWLMLRPEHLRLLNGGDRSDVHFEAVCFNTYLLGSRTHVHAKANGATYICELDAGAPPPAPGTSLRLGFDWADAVGVTE